MGSDAVTSRQPSRAAAAAAAGADADTDKSNIFIHQQPLAITISPCSKYPQSIRQIDFLKYSVTQASARRSLSDTSRSKVRLYYSAL